MLTKYGRWTVISPDGDGRQGYIECQCSCGKVRQVGKHYLKAGLSRSCGCLQREIASQTRTTHGATRGDSSPALQRLYDAWVNIKQRCLNPNANSFSHYGGRGIKMCPEWRDDFTIFRDWALAHGHAPGLQIDRIDNEGNYDPENCQWVTRLVNANNRSNGIFVTAFEETKTLAQWQRDPRCKVPYQTLRERVKRGWHGESAISTPSLRPLSDQDITSTMAVMFKYEKIADDLRGQISRGEIAKGDRLPSTSKLRQQYQVSYGSVRSAILILKAEELVEGKQGDGVFAR